MKLLCRIFGHSPPAYKHKGWWSPGEEYGKVVTVGMDGIGRGHWHLRGECARCGEEFLVGRFHVPQEAHQVWIDIRKQQRESQT